MSIVLQTQRRLSANEMDENNAYRLVIAFLKLCLFNKSQPIQ